jgi:hypothetical protein
MWPRNLPRKDEKKPCPTGEQGSTGWKVVRARGSLPMYRHRIQRCCCYFDCVLLTSGPSFVTCCKPQILLLIAFVHDLQVLLHLQSLRDKRSTVRFNSTRRGPRRWRNQSLHEKKCRLVCLNPIQRNEVDSAGNLTNCRRHIEDGKNCRTSRRNIRQLLRRAGLLHGFRRHCVVVRHHSGHGAIDHPCVLCHARRVLIPRAVHGFAVVCHARSRCAM